MSKQHGIFLNNKVYYFANRAEAYRIYIRSTTWKKLRDKRIEIDEYKCRLCNSDKRLEVHHRRYPIIFGYENLEDLTTLCHRCHRIFTNIERRDKYLKRRIETENVKRLSIPFKIANNDQIIKPESIKRISEPVKYLRHSNELSDLKPEDHRRISSTHALRATRRSDE